MSLPDPALYGCPDRMPEETAGKVMVNSVDLKEGHSYDSLLEHNADNLDRINELTDRFTLTAPPGNEGEGFSCGGCGPNPETTLAIQLIVFAVFYRRRKRQRRSVG